MKKYRSRKAFEEAKRRRRRLFWIFLTTIIVVLVTIVTVTRLERFSINTVVVEGEQTVGTDQIEKAVDLQLDNTQFLVISNQTSLTFPKSKTERSILEAIPSLETADITIDDQTLTVSVQEKAPYAALCATQKFALEECSVIDDNGNIFSLYTSEIQSKGIVPIIIQSFKGDESNEDEESGIQNKQTFLFLYELIEIYSQLPQGAQQEYFMTSPDDTVDVHYPSGSYIRFMAKRDLLKQVSALEVSFTKLDRIHERIDEYEYIDLRFDDRVYFKKKNEIQEEVGVNKNTDTEDELTEEISVDTEDESTIEIDQ